MQGAIDSFAPRTEVRCEVIEQVEDPVTDTHALLPVDEPDEAIDFRTRYARFCGRIYERKYEEWFSRGFDDLPRLCSIPGVVHVGIRKDGQALLVGTEHIYVLDRLGEERDIGEIIAIFNPFEKQILFANVTRTMRKEPGEGNNTYQHPHVMNGNMCISTGKDLMMSGMADGLFSRTVSIAMTALFMRPGTVTINTPYLDAHLWPKRGERP